MKKNLLVILAGLVVGAASVVLVASGNPGNMGFCIACFLRDISGALGLHSAGVVQYIRPEICGLVIGSAITAIIAGEFKSRGGSAPFTRLTLGFTVMVGALMFLGCPLRMFLRIGGGDLNAIIGLVGFIGGILLGTLSLNKGFTLKRSYIMSKGEGSIMPVVAVALMVLLLLAPQLLNFSTEGPGSMRAPVIVALICGLVVGALAQRTRLCTVGGIRDALMFRDFHLFAGSAAIIVAAIIGNLIVGGFNPGFEGQSVAHTDGVWNFLGMALVGWASVLLGGCPMRQLILAGEGNTDSAITVIGMVIGAAFCHNFGLASSAAGPTVNGKAAVIIGFVVVLAITVCNIEGLITNRKAAEVNQ